MLITRGQGGWILVSPLVFFAVSMLVDRWIYPISHSPLYVVVPLALAGLSCIALGLHARLHPGFTAIDARTGRPMRMRPVHSAYFIRAEYWGVAFLGVAAWGLWH